MRKSSALRATAWSVVALGAAAPLVRRKARLPKPAVAAAAFAAPVALSVARPRTPGRDVAMCLLQMWAYIAMYEMPHDDPEALAKRVKIDYPVQIDRILGLGQLPGARLQRAFGRPGRVRRGEQVLVWAHWVWFFVPHSSALYVLVRKRERFPRTAALLYSTFDTGVLFYWLIPTAPPWYAAQAGRAPELRRIMIEHGEAFWKDNWAPLYSFLGGNPLAAMPSLHFATSVMSAHLLTEAGPVEGAVGWTYALTLGFALVYLGEHYVCDLVAGYALVRAVRRLAPVVTPVATRFSRGLQRLEAAARP